MTPVAAIPDEAARTLTERLARIRERARERTGVLARRSPSPSGDGEARVPEPREPVTDRAQHPSIVQPTAAGDRLTCTERHVLLSLMAQIERRAAGAQTTAQTPFEITAEGVCELFGITPAQGYDLLREATDRLARRWVTIHAPDPRNPALETTKTPLVHAIDYLPSRGRLRLYLTPTLLPYLNQLAAAVRRARGGARRWPEPVSPRGSWDERKVISDWFETERSRNAVVGQPPAPQADCAIGSGHASAWVPDRSR